MGVGAGLLYIPSLAMVGVWFSKKRALAMGIVMSGIAVGTSTSIPSRRSYVSTGGSCTPKAMLG
jgi:MFS family permease